MKKIILTLLAIISLGLAGCTTLPEEEAVLEELSTVEVEETSEDIMDLEEDDSEAETGRLLYEHEIPELGIKVSLPFTEDEIVIAETFCGPDTVCDYDGSSVAGAVDVESVKGKVLASDSELWSPRLSRQSAQVLDIDLCDEGRSDDCIVGIGELIYSGRIEDHEFYMYESYAALLIEEGDFTEYDRYTAVIELYEDETYQELGISLPKSYISEDDFKSIVNSIEFIKNEQLVIDDETWVTYTNDKYGFSFEYPSEWGRIGSLVEYGCARDDDTCEHISLNFTEYGDDSLFLALQTKSFRENHPGRGGYWGDNLTSKQEGYTLEKHCKFTDSDDCITYMNSNNEFVVKAIEFQPIADTYTTQYYMESVDSDYRIVLSTERLADEGIQDLEDKMDALVDSFSINSLDSEGTDSLQTYTNDEYRFSFEYPGSYNFETLDGELLNNVENESHFSLTNNISVVKVKYFDQILDEQNISMEEALLLDLDHGAPPYISSEYLNVNGVSSYREFRQGNAGPPDDITLVKYNLVHENSVLQIYFSTSSENPEPFIEEFDNLAKSIIWD